MLMGSVCNIDGRNLSTEDLLSYLSQVTLTMTDEETKRKHKLLEGCRDNVSKLRKELKKQKDVQNSLVLEQSRQKQLGRVLSLLDTLKREGVLTGRNAQKISRVLDDIEDKDFRYLRDLEERLAVYLPG
jgi:Mg/Co/Ni transporter MgtE